LWRIQGSNTWSGRVRHSATLQCQGSLRALKRDAFPAKQSQFDGWHRLCWLTTEDRGYDKILVCSRRVAAVFDLTGELKGTCDMRLGPKSDGNLVLDIKPGRQSANHIHVLTTSRILVFSTSATSWRVKDQEEPLTLICSWTHFRDGLAQNLSLCLLELRYGTIPRTTYLNLC
jgi:hypothetical protein